MSRSSTLWIGAALICLLLLFWLRDLRDRRPTGWSVGEDELDVLERPDGIGARIRRAFLEVRREPESEPARKLTQAEAALASGRIRRFYQRLNQLAGKRGRARRAACSPLHLVAELKPLFPGLEADLQVIAKSYLRLEKGLLPENQGQVHAIEKSWLRLRAQRESAQRAQPQERVSPVVQSSR